MDLEDAVPMSIHRNYELDSPALYDSSDDGEIEFDELYHANKPLPEPLEDGNLVTCAPFQRVGNRKKPKGLKLQMKPTEMVETAKPITKPRPRTVYSPCLKTDLKCSSWTDFNNAEMTIKTDTGSRSEDMANCKVSSLHNIKNYEGFCSLPGVNVSSNSLISEISKPINVKSKETLLDFLNDQNYPQLSVSNLPSQSFTTENSRTYAQVVMKKPISDVLHCGVKSASNKNSEIFSNNDAQTEVSVSINNIKYSVLQHDSYKETAKISGKTSETRISSQNTICSGKSGVKQKWFISDQTNKELFHTNPSHSRKTKLNVSSTSINSTSISNEYLQHKSKTQKQHKNDKVKNVNCKLNSFNSEIKLSQHLIYTNQAAPYRCFPTVSIRGKIKKNLGNICTLSKQILPQTRDMDYFHPQTSSNSSTLNPANRQQIILNTKTIQIAKEKSVGIEMGCNSKHFMCAAQIRDLNEMEQCNVIKVPYSVFKELVGFCIVKIFKISFLFIIVRILL